MRRHRSSSGPGPGHGHGIGGVGLTVLAALACSTVPARASAETSLAVLGIEAVNVPEPVAAQLTDALRERAAATAGLRLAAGKDFVEMKSIFGCDGEVPACMTQAGRSLGADKLLYGSLRKASGRKLTVDLRLLDVRAGVVDRTVNETLLSRDLTGDAVRVAASRFVLALFEARANPVLSVSSQPAGAAVAVDGQPMGRTPVVATLEPLTPKPPPMVVAPAPVARLEPAVVAPSPAPAPTDHSGRTAQIIGITSLAAAVVTGSVAIYTWRVYSGLQDTTHQELRALAPGAPTAEQAHFFEKPSCTPPSSLSGSAVNKYKSDCSSGHTYAAATTGLWVASGALALGGVVSLIVGARQAAKAKEQHNPQRSPQIIRESLRLAPVFSTQSGGVVASFDF
jgi:TolB-like protein